MKFKITIAFFVLAILCSLCTARPADEYEEYADEPAPPPKPAVRPIVGRRNPLIRGGAASKSTTTTTTTVAPNEQDVEEEIVDEEAPEEEAAPAETSSTTESGRKLKGGILRPFRSNEDLLATLKKRREQAAINKNHLKAQVHEPQESSPVAAEAEKPASKPRASPGRRKYNKNENVAQAQEVESTSSAPARTSRRFRN